MASKKILPDDVEQAKIVQANQDLVNAALAVREAKFSDLSENLVTTVVLLEAVLVDDGPERLKRIRTSVEDELDAEEG